MSSLNETRTRIDELAEKSKRKQEYVYEAYEQMVAQEMARPVAEFSEQVGEAINRVVEDRRSLHVANTPEYFLVVVLDQLLTRMSELKET